MKQKVGLIQVDGKMPNLALMKLARWHKDQGDDVRVVDISGFGFNKIYGSKIFMGGSGYDLKQKLPKEIEELVPDYETFNLDYSIGFTSRGCIRNCGFCIVKEKEGEFKDDSMSWIKHSKVILLDNNFFASKMWREKLQHFIENKMKVNFNQGLDIRLMDEEKAEMLSKVNFYDRTFTQKRVYFAFDHPAFEQVVRDKLKILLKYIKAYKIMVYILVGFNTTFEDDMKRFEVLKEFGVDPYVMIYNNRKDDKKLRDFARWVNKRICKVCDFKDYDKSVKRSSLTGSDSRGKK